MRPYTVKIPPQWTGINSARAQAYLRDYFIHPLTLPADPGPGEHAVCLTLSERLVGKLAEGTGEKPAVALRRLLAARIRELPAVSSPAPESRSIVHTRTKPKPKQRAFRGRDVPQKPIWFSGSDAAWKQEFLNSPEYWLARIDESAWVSGEQRRASAAQVITQGKSDEMAQRKNFSLLGWVLDHPWVALILGLAILYILFERPGWLSRAGTGAGTAAASRWPAWVPR